jgi:heavy metal efflux system protein
LEDHMSSASAEDTAVAQKIKNEVIMLELQKAAQKLDFYETGTRDYYQQLELGNNRKYQMEEISYLEYCTVLFEILHLKLEYLENLDQYNQQIIQLEYQGYEK